MSAFAARLRPRAAEYAVCPEDGFAFRPRYTGGKCPLCGEEAISDGPSELPWLLRFDRFRLGLAALIFASLAMSALVLVMYFK